MPVSLGGSGQVAVGILLHRLIGLEGGEPSGTGKAFSKKRSQLANGRGALVCELYSPVA